MKINEIINEVVTEAEVKPYDVEKLEVARAVELLNQYCSESLSLIQRPIWRGIRHDFGTIMKIDPTTGIRKSNNTMNYYTELMDNSPYFAGWPMRSRSLVCSTDTFKAQNYGAKYAIFPFNGVKIAVCPGSDIFDTQVSLPELMEHSLSFGGGYASLVWYLNNLGLPDNYEGMVEATSSPKFKQKLARTNKRLSVYKMFGFIQNPKLSENFVTMLQKAMAPANTGFELVTIEQFASRPTEGKEGRSRELWIGGPVIAIKHDLYNRFLHAFNKGQK